MQHCTWARQDKMNVQMVLFGDRGRWLIRWLTCGQHNFVVFVSEVFSVRQFSLKYNMTDCEPKHLPLLLLSWMLNRKKKCSSKKEISQLFYAWCHVLLITFINVPLAGQQIDAEEASWFPMKEVKLWSERLKTKMNLCILQGTCNIFYQNVPANAVYFFASMS